ncbi:MAG: DUF5995 family protein [Bacteroidota bacterium]
MPGLPKTIDEVISQLDQIIQDCIAANDPKAYFGFLYRRVTAEIRDCLGTGVFEDDSRMERFDVDFANRYLDAYFRLQAGQPISQAWKVAFDATDQSYLILQHLLLGMNAHINLDLGIAAADTMIGRSLADLESDYKVVNDILQRISDDIQEKLGRVSPLLFLADKWAGGSDEFLIDKAIRASRGLAWKLACTLENLQGSEREAAIRLADQQVYKLAKAILSPIGPWFQGFLNIVRFFETSSVQKALTRLQSD